MIQNWPTAVVLVALVIAAVVVFTTVWEHRKK